MFVDSRTRLGSLYDIGDFLGEGQYASVLECTRLRDRQQFALKTIDKARITNFPGLRRMSTEIEILRKLSSRFVVSLEEVIQTSSRIYIVMEKGGSDLFEFFGKHPRGVPDEWAKQIISSLIKAVGHIHQNHVCHRDIKPENVLMNFDMSRGKCIDLKLCDFGLSAKFKEKVPLSDFCGSPGFFDPEMVMEGVHYGDKADIWSMGCIMLELMLGHQLFCDHWMISYEHNIIKDKGIFSSTMRQTVGNLPNVLNFTRDFNDFCLKVMVISSNKRMSVLEMAQHPWLADHNILPLTPQADRSSGETNFRPGSSGDFKKACAPSIKNPSKQPSPKAASLFEASKGRK